MSNPDVIDTLIPLQVGSPVHTVRHQRNKVVAATQGSYQALFDPSVVGLSVAERLLTARHIARSANSAVLAKHYDERLKALPTLLPAESAALEDQPTDSRLQAVFDFARTLTERPVEGDQAALSRLAAAGLETVEIIALTQLIAFVAYQLRVVAGLQSLQTMSMDDGVTPSVLETAPFIHPAELPKPGEPVRIKGFTSESLEWKAWLPVLALDQATPEQLSILESSHPKAKSSEYYLLLAHQPRILEERSIVFNAIMYAPGGLSRAERELASAAVSRVNGCVYCAAVHAQRFEQLTKRNDVIVQLFDTPQTAGTTARERAIVQAAIALTVAPIQFGSSQLQAVRAAGLSALEIVDLIHATAIFAWANRLMLNLGEPVFP
jgi:uncharacterized peroxidase-related enzyme